jgi:hypothetical protein
MGRVSMNPRKASYYCPDTAAALLSLGRQSDITCLKHWFAILAADLLFQEIQVEARSLGLLWLTSLPVLGCRIGLSDDLTFAARSLRQRNGIYPIVASRCAQ